ncbi:MAG TPA: hypothetical protein VJ933_06570 [Phaeodactylibacter sp.]|nr:hypothetical protein [Phaeodactylibacter sp.]
MRNCLHLLFLLLFAPTLMLAQPEALWGQRFAVSDPIFSFGKNLKFTDMDTDPAGNVYLVGFHRADLRLGADTISLPYDGPQTSFLMKIDADGAVLWQRQFTMADMKAVQYRDGFVYVAGEIATAEYGPLSIQENAANERRTIFGMGNRDGFVAKYDATGTLSWVKRYGGPDSEALNKGDHLNDLAVDSQGRIYICGSYHRAFSLSANISFEESSDRGKTFYLAALDNEGDPIWATNLDSPLPTDGGNAEGLSLTLNAEEEPAVVMAYSAGGLLIDGEILLNDNQNGDRGSLLVQYDQAGNRQWLLNIEPLEGLIVPFGLEADGTGRLYLGFSHEQQVLIGETDELKYFQEEDDLLKTGLICVDPAGTLQWAQTYFCSDAAIDVHPSDGLYLIAAAFRNAVNLSDDFALDFQGAGSTSLWARIRSDGTFDWAGKPNTPEGAPFSTSHQITVDAEGFAYLAANFNRRLEFPPDIALENGYGSPDFDALYLVQLSNESPSASTALAVRPLKAFPNPSSGTLQVEAPTSMMLVLRNAQGQTVWKRFLPKGTQQVNFGSLPTGPYWLSGHAEEKLYHCQLMIR